MKMNTPPQLLDCRVVLASQSPRRRELLAKIVPDIRIAKPCNVDETYPEDLPHELVPEWLSKLKASAFQGDLKPGEILLTADTVVILDDKILGKPHDEADAKCMLRDLSDRTHTVVTGVTLTTTDTSLSFSEHTDVEFGPLSDAEISAYVDAYRPLDKAGAYGIQEWIGEIGILGIRGCFYNVMGLPLHALYEHLKKLRHS